jgi:hypothetical protein
MKKILLIVILGSIQFFLFSQVKIIDSFSNLDSLAIKNENFWLDNNFIKFDSSISTVYNIKSDINIDYSGDYEYAVGIDNIKLIKTKLNRNENKYYFITFGSIDGPSIGFTIFEEKLPNKIIGQIRAASLIVPGNGSLYSIDRYWENFETKRKYSFIEEKIVENKQPFYSVNLISFALRPIDIYSDINLENKLASIPVKGKIEVILCTDSNSRSDIYLVRTSFGLIGWAKLVTGQYQSVDVEGLYYNGD